MQCKSFNYHFNDDDFHEVFTDNSMKAKDILHGASKYKTFTLLPYHDKILLVEALTSLNPGIPIDFHVLKCYIKQIVDLYPIHYPAETPYTLSVSSISGHCHSDGTVSHQQPRSTSFSCILTNILSWL